MNNERTPPRSKLPTAQPEGYARSPPPPIVKSTNDVKQSDIFSFFTGKTAAVHNSAPTSRISHKSHLILETNTPRHQVNGKGSKSLGAHPTDETAIIAGSPRAPPPQEIMKSTPSASVPGKKTNGSLLSWRVMGETTSEPSARALSLHNPHNLCYANAVLHMLHYARSFAGQISGLGALCGALTQAARSNGETNIARDSAWSFIWNGWQRPTHQHDAAEFLQHLCQKTDCTALRGGWEARRHRGGAYEILDEQFTCPHIRLILERPFHLQDAVDKWHQQECVHAFTRPPDTLILQVGRFLQTERGYQENSSKLSTAEKSAHTYLHRPLWHYSAHRL